MCWEHLKMRSALHQAFVGKNALVLVRIGERLYDEPWTFYAKVCDKHVDEYKKAGLAEKMAKDAMAYAERLMGSSDPGVTEPDVHG